MPLTKQIPTLVLSLIAMFSISSSLMRAAVPAAFRPLTSQYLGGSGYHSLSLLLGRKSQVVGTKDKSNRSRQSSKLSFASKLVTGAGIVAIASSQLEAQCDSIKETETESSKVDDLKDTAMFPPITAYKTGSLQVSPVHTIAYSLYGNPAGKPVLFIHGGPGGGTDPKMARYFDPTRYHIILVDQRGCGKSKPFASLEDNTTYDSVRDFEKIRVMLNIEKWMLFGGSWGSTLSLAYAMTHPERVTELVLRGIFLLRKKELNWLYQGPGANYLFPEDWAAYEAAIPEGERGDYLEAYRKRLKGELGEEEMYKAARAWSVWEGRTSNLIQAPAETTESKFGDKLFSLIFASIENHYFVNKGWFPRDGYLIEKEQIDKIRHLPTIIVQGRYDVVCPAISAYELKQALPEADLRITLAGHSGMEKENIRELVAATEKFKNL